MAKQPTIRERVARFLVGDKIKQLDVATKLFLEANDRQVIPTSIEKLQESMAGLDPHLIDFLVRSVQDKGMVSDEIGDSMRLSLIKESRSLYLWDVITQSVIDMWTDFAFGSQVTVKCADPAADEWWSEFWDATRNSPIIGERVLKDLSKDLLVDGELFLTFFTSTLDGETTIRTVPADEIAELVTKPGDKKKRLYYRRDYISEDGQPGTIYYRDWQATPQDLAFIALPTDAVIADTPETSILMMQVGYRMAGKRGIPLMTAGAPWSRAYKNFLQDRAAVSKHAAMYPSKVIVKGGQNAVNDIRSRLESSLVNSGSMTDTNPAAVAGSTWIENEALTRSSGVMHTGAVEAETDSSMILAMAGLSGRLYPHYLGRGEAFRLATATAMEQPTLKAFNRYQRFWIETFRDMVDIILQAAEDYGGKSFSTFEADISLDPVLEDEPNQLSLAMDQISIAAQRGYVDPEVAKAGVTSILGILLKSVGVENVDEIMMLTTDNQEYKEYLSEVVNELLEGATMEQYRRAIDRLVYGLWAMKISPDDFYFQMTRTIDRGLRGAWETALQEVGMEKGDMSNEENSALNQSILDEYGYIDNFMLWIMDHNKASGTKLKDLSYRTALWANRWNDIKNRALLTLQQNPPLTWQLGATEEHCESCAYANGKTYRAAVWARWGWAPQSQALECKGFNCDCSLLPLGEKVNKGHPKRLA